MIYEGTLIDEFIADLRHASMDCGFDDQLENRLKDIFVIGMRSDHIKKMLLDNEDKDLRDILKKARALELVDNEHISSKSISAAQNVRTSRSPQRQEAYKHLNARGDDSPNLTRFVMLNAIVVQDLDINLINVSLLHKSGFATNVVELNTRRQCAETDLIHRRPNLSKGLWSQPMNLLQKIKERTLQTTIVLSFKVNLEVDLSM